MAALLDMALALSITRIDTQILSVYDSITFQKGEFEP